jgi:thimet oligopeptidase
MRAWLRILLLVLSVVAAVSLLKTCDIANYKDSMRKKAIVHIQQLFPQTVHDIDQRVEEAMRTARERITALCAISAQEQNWSNTALAYDRAVAYEFMPVFNVIWVIANTSKDQELRTKAQQSIEKLEKFSIDTFSHNEDLYKTFKRYVEGAALKESLSPENKRFLEDIMKGFKYNGFDLSAEKRDQVAALNKDLSVLALKFEENINNDNRAIFVTREELDGLDSDFITALEKNDEGLYKLTTAYPIFFAVMENCTNAQTRERLYHEFNNRAYPANEAVLKEIIAKRDQLAKLLGFESYAELNLDDEMVKSPQRARAFLDDLAQRIQAKEMEEFKQFTKDLPPSVVLSQEGTLNPWDRGYLIDYHKKKYYNIDKREIAQYFPMEKTIEGLLGIYQQFFNLSMEELPINGLWDDQVRLLEISKKNADRPLGYILLDLHPRPYKYTHACYSGIIPGLQGSDQPSVGIVLANFAQSTPNKPSLLKLEDEVKTFFHEFGHAIHGLLGITTLASYSGTNVKRDFVELPSQILEEWLCNPSIIKSMSSHYQTGEKLSDEVIDKIIASKNFSTGFFTTRQLCLAYISLDCFENGADKDLEALFKQNFKRMRRHETYNPQDHMLFSFGHLTGYGARYYGYLWSKVFALDIFDMISSQDALLNPNVGERYAATILAPGGSQDPNDMLKNFLGREPSAHSFFKDLGIE